MKKFIEKIFILLIMIILVFTMLGLNYSYATEATISVPSVTVGQDFTVTVNIPAEAVAYEGYINVTFSDGTTKSSGKLTFVTGINEDFKHPGNMSFTFNAAKEGNATVTVTGLYISDRNYNQVNTKTSLTHGFTVAANTPAPEPTPEPTPTPETPAAQPPASNEPTWQETGDTVYALEDLNVRSGWGTSYNRVGKLSKNASTKRIAVGSNGWDKIEYNGTTAYVMSKYLTTQNPAETKPEEPEPEPTWKETGDTVYSLQNLNVREGWGTSFKVIGSLSKNAETKRIAVGSNGWDKIDYKGKTAYVMSKYLTTEKPKEEPVNNTVDNTVNNTVENTSTNNVVDNSVAENKTVDEGEIYNQIIDEVGVIPPVGKSIVDYIYLGAVILSIIMISVVGIKIRENNKE